MDFGTSDYTTYDADDVLANQSNELIKRTSISLFIVYNSVYRKNQYIFRIHFTPINDFNLSQQKKTLQKSVLTIKIKHFLTFFGT